MMGRYDERSSVNEHTDETGLVPEAPVIESASGTTDPRNSESGPTAYVVFGVVAGLLVLLAMSVSSCTAALGSIASSSYLWEDEGHDDLWGEGYDTEWPWSEDGYGVVIESPYDA